MYLFLQFQFLKLFQFKIYSGQHRIKTSTVSKESKLNKPVSALIQLFPLKQVPSFIESKLLLGAKLYHSANWVVYLC